jgi:hypothetical protein
VAFHRLADLELRGRELALAIDPAFDLYNAKRVLRLVVDLDHASTVTLDLEYIIGTSSYAVRVVFEGVRHLVVPPVGPGLFVNELEISDVRGSGIEGLRYEVASRFDDSFRCACRDISITSVEQRD